MGADDRRQGPARAHGAGERRDARRVARALGSIGLKISTARPKKTIRAGRCLAPSSFRGPTRHAGDIGPGQGGDGEHANEAGYTADGLNRLISRMVTELVETMDDLSLDERRRLGQANAHALRHTFASEVARYYAGVAAHRRGNETRIHCSTRL